MVAVETCISKLKLVKLHDISLKTGENVKAFVSYGRTQKLQAACWLVVRITFNKRTYNSLTCVQLLCLWLSRIHNMPKYTTYDHNIAMIEKLLIKEQGYFINQNYF